MMLSTVSIVAVVTSCVCIIALIKVLKRTKSQRGMPSGPKGWPLLGAVGKIDFSNLSDEFFKFRKMYGEIFSFHIFNKRIVVLCGAKTIREVLNKNLEATGRVADGFAIDNPHGYGIIDNSGEHHKVMRDFVTKSFRDFGFEKRSLEILVQEEALAFLEKLRGKNGQPFNVNADLSIGISNIICSFALGQKLQNMDGDLLKAIKENDKIVSHPLKLLPVFIPERLLKLVPGDLFGVWTREKSINGVIQFLQEFLEEHKKSFDSNFERDFIDAFLKMQKERGCQIFSDENLLRTIYDLFMAGTETVVATVKWSILLLLHNPDVQKKMRQEIESTIGRTQMPTIDHKPLLPYCEAVILEVQRHRNLAPFSIIRLVTSDIAYDGVVIPKGSILFPFLLSAAMDDKIFPNPEQFDPNRFLDDDGKIMGPNRIVSFSTGKRVCLGEQLAKLELFLFIVSIVQNFQLVPEDPDKLPTLDGMEGGLLLPKPFKFRAITVE